MGKTNTPFEEIYFSITAVNTVDSTATTEVFDYLSKPFRFNTETANQLKLASLPANERYYKPSKGGIMKVLTVESKDDLDKYFVSNLNNPTYASLVNMVSNSPSSSRLKVLLFDGEEEVGDGVIPNKTDILKTIHEDDSTKLAYAKMLRFKDQIHTLGYWVQGFEGLGYKEAVDTSVIASLTPEMLSLSLLDKKASNDPVTPDALLPADKAAILSASVDVDYNIQDNTLFTFELLSEGAEVAITDINTDDRTKLEASDIKVTYTKRNGNSEIVTLPATALVDQGGTSTEIHPAAKKVLDFNKTRITKVEFADATIPAKYTLSTLTAPTSEETLERFVVKSIFEDTEVHVIVTNSLTTKLADASEIISVNFVSNVELNNKFGFSLEEKDKIDVPAEVLNYIYVKLAEVKIAKGFGTNENECYTFIDAAALASISGTIFSYNAPLSTVIYDMLKAEGEGSPTTLIRGYDAETQAGEVVDLTSLYENSASPAAMSKFFSTSINGGMDFQRDILAGNATYTESFIDKIGLPTLENSSTEDIDLGIKTLAFATPVKTRGGTVVYFWSEPISLVKTGEFYNTARECFIKAYCRNSVNVIITDAIVSLVSKGYTQELVDSINDALNDVLSTIKGVFGNQIQMTLNPIEYNESRTNPSIQTVTDDQGVRTTYLKLTNIADVTVTKGITKFTLSYETKIQG